MVLSLRYGAVSDIGRYRKKNDDSGYAGPHLLVVADGMGGAPAGDVASTVAIQTLKRLDVPPPEDVLEGLAGTISIANERLAEIIEDDDSVDGMGTTLTAAVFDGRQIGVAHLGDSRGYLWRDGELLRITRDHSWVQTLIDEGRISEEEASTHSHRSLLLKVLDGRHDNDPDLSTYDVQPGDRVLICSDGLSGFVPHERMQRALAGGSPQEVAADLTALALESGSTDNITVIVGDVVEAPQDPATAPVVVGAVAAAQHRSTFSRLRTLGQRDETQPYETLVGPGADPEELRYAPRPPHRWMWLRGAVLLLFAAALVAVVLTLAYQWTQRQYFVGNDNGRVAIYRGVNSDLPGVSLHHVYADSHLKVSQLPAFRRQQVTGGITAGASLVKAQQIVATLHLFSRGCSRPAPSPSTPGPPLITTTPSTAGPATATVPPAVPAPGSASVEPPTELQPPVLPDCRHGHSRSGGGR